MGHFCFWMKRFKKPKAIGRYGFKSLREFQDITADHFGERRKLWFEVKLDQIPEWPCCYVIFVDYSLVYVGQTTNLKYRMWAHFAKGSLRGTDRGRIEIKAKLGRRYGSWAMDELRLLERLKPRWNAHGIQARPECFE